MNDELFEIFKSAGMESLDKFPINETTRMMVAFSRYSLGDEDFWKKTK
jgi:hypothetical protein